MCTGIQKSIETKFKEGLCEWKSMCINVLGAYHRQTDGWTDTDTDTHRDALIHTYTQMHSYTHTHRCTHTNTHTHTHTQMPSPTPIHSSTHSHTYSPVGIGLEEDVHRPWSMCILGDHERQDDLYGYHGHCKQCQPLLGHP